MTPEIKKALDLAHNYLDRLIRGLNMDDTSEAVQVRDAIKQALAAPVQEPVAWQERQARRMSQGVVTEWTNWYPCRHRTIDDAREEASDHIPYEWRPLYTTPPAQPAPVQEPVFKPCSCRWKGEEQVQQCTLHAAHIEAIHEWAERAKTAEAKLKEKNT